MSASGRLYQGLNLLPPRRSLPSNLKSGSNQKHRSPERSTHNGPLCDLLWSDPRRWRHKRVQLLPPRPDIAGVMTFLINLSTTTIRRWSAEPINWLWTGTPTHTKINTSQYFLFAIDVEIRLPLWRWGMVWSIAIRNTSIGKGEGKLTYKEGAGILPLRWFVR